MEYTLEMLIQEGQDLVSDSPDIPTRNTRFNNFFDRLGVPSEPDALRITLRQAILDFDSNTVYEPAIIDNAALLYTDWDFIGEQIILPEGEYKYSNLMNLISRGYKRTLEEDANREWLIDVGSSNTNPKNIASFSPWLNNPYNPGDFFISANLNIDNQPQNTENTTEEYEVRIDGYNVDVYRIDYTPGWKITLKGYSRKTFRNIRAFFDNFGMPPSWVKLVYDNILEIQRPNLSDITDDVFKFYGYKNRFTVDAMTMFIPNTSGTYTFYLSSDDGSKLYIYDTVTEKWTYIINRWIM